MTAPQFTTLTAVTPRGEPCYAQIHTTRRQLVRVVWRLESGTILTDHTYGDTP